MSSEKNEILQVPFNFFQLFTSFALPPLEVPPPRRCRKKAMKAPTSPLDCLFDALHLFLLALYVTAHHLHTS